MTQLTDPLDRRSGIDRRQDAPPAAARGGSPIADWPVVVPTGLTEIRAVDPWARIVHQAIIGAAADGASGGDAAVWEPDVVWRLAGPDPTGLGGAVVGMRGIRAYHRELGNLTDGTYRQDLVAIESGRGPIVEVHLRTTAIRGGRTLDLPTLLVVELRSLRIRLATEFPGDLAAWASFWAT